MTRLEAIEKLKKEMEIKRKSFGIYSPHIEMAIKALESLDKLDEIIVEQIDVSNNQVECQTLRWVLDKMSEMSEVEE